MSTRRRRRPPSRRRARSSRRTGWLVGGALAAAVVALAVFLVASGGSGTASSAGPAAAPGPRRPAPDVTLEDFAGRPVRISDLRGRPAVVNFWASWCVPCLAELPRFEAVYERHRDRVAFLGINLADDVEPALQVVADTGIRYPLARDPEGAAFTAFGALGMPTTVFLDANGDILELWTGELSGPELEARIVKYFERS